MRDSIKLIYTGIYILFLLTAFILFASIKNASGGNVLSYTTLFMIIITGSLLYYLAVRKTEVDENTLKDNKQASEVTVKEEAEQVEVKVAEEEAQIDVQKLMPPRTLGIDKYSEELLQNMAEGFNMVQALFYVRDPNEDLFRCNAQYAYFSENKPVEFRAGETLPGQAVKNKTIVSLSNIPDQYMTIASGLGKSNPKQLVFVPLKNQDDVVGLIEYATFEPLTEKQMKALEGISKKVADTISKHLKK